VSKELKTPIAIIQDLQGPKIRIGKVDPEGVKVKKGETIFLDIEIDFTKCLYIFEYIVKEFGYTDMQVQITHNKHFEKIQSLLTEFNSLTCNKESDKVLSNIYSEHLIRFLSSFKLNQQAILTKHGMQYCNDIYNWYEGIKGYINTGGAKRT
jgi:hypothetical protein